VAVRWVLLTVATLAAGCEFSPGVLLPEDLSMPLDLTMGDGPAQIDSGDMAMPPAPDMTGGPVLSLTRTSVNGTVSLTSEGSTDWIHLGLASATDVNRKQGANKIMLSATGSLVQYSGYVPSFTWIDGTPTTSASATHGGVYVTMKNDGFTVVVPADETARTLRVYVAQYMSTGALTAHLSDSSAADGNDVQIASSPAYWQYQVDYRAASAGQTLTVVWTKTTGGGGDVDLQAATLQ